MVSLSPWYSIVFSFLARLRNLSLFSVFFFTLLSIGLEKSSGWHIFSFFKFTLDYGLLVGIWCAIYISKSNFLGQILFCSNTICQQNLILLQNSQQIIFTTQSCLWFAAFAYHMLNRFIIVTTWITIAIIIIYIFRVFHISVSWWFFTGFWATASLLNSPGLFSVFWLSSIMLSFGGSLLVR